MSEFICAIIGIIIGGAVGVLVMSMLTVSKRADEDAKKAFESYDFARGINKTTIRHWICPHCRKVTTLNNT